MSLRLPPLVVTTTLLASVGCSADKGGRETPVSCISALAVAGLSSQTLFECTSVDVAASFEFDPDKRPAARTIDLTIHGAEGGGVDCGLTLSLRGLCGAGTYEVGRAVSGSLVTSDCPGVDDADEGTFALDGGAVQVATAALNAPIGAAAEGEYLMALVLAAELSAGERVVVGGLEITAMVPAHDADEQECLQSTGDGSGAGGGSGSGSGDGGSGGSGDGGPGGDSGGESGGGSGGDSGDGGGSGADGSEPVDAARGYILREYGWGTSSPDDTCLSGNILTWRVSRATSCPDCAWAFAFTGADDPVVTTCPEGSPANRWHGEYPRFGVIEDYLGYGPTIAYGAGLSDYFRPWAFATKTGNRWEFEQYALHHYYYSGSWFTNTYVGYIEGYAQE